MCIVHDDKIHNRGTWSHKLSAFRKYGCNLSVFRCCQAWIDKEGGNFVHCASCCIYHASCRCTVLTLCTVYCHLILFVGGTFGGLCGTVHGFYFVLSLRSDNTVFVQCQDALVGCLCQGQVTLGFIPELPGSGNDLSAGTGIDFLILFLGNLFQGIYLPVFGFYRRTIDDDECITCLHPVAFADKEWIYTPGKFTADTDFGCFYLSLEHKGLMTHEQHSQERD